MTVIDKQGTEVDTREFWRELGITDEAALGELVVAYGKECAVDRLEEVRDLVRLGCFRDADALRCELEELFGCHPDDPYGQAAIAALLAVRTFTEVSTEEQAKRYLGGDAVGFVLLTLVEQLGETVPEWFFPALVTLAHQVSKTRFGPHAQSKFATLLRDCLEAWDYVSPDAPRDNALVATLVLSYFGLARRPQGDGGWLLQLPEQLF